MMGLSLGPVFGRTVSEIANGEKLSVDIDIFRPERFN
jgi:D-amino-acid dehydrogenase